ncbi:RNA-directed DNA polymerase from mobile element jockey, partial [Stegodyphus mimosarum]
MIKRFPVKIMFYLTKILNVILQWQHFPEIWKTAKITPILKAKKPASSPDSYRPISLLSSLSKILEAVLLRRINDYLEHNGIIIPYQFGFRRHHSTVNQLYRVVEFITEGAQQKKVTGGLFLDIAKAFDRVWLEALIYKLHNLGFPGYIINTVNSYLTGRHFVVQLANTLSTRRKILAGVPQGSLLGPTLFNIYVNDIPVTDNTTLAMYADDTAILTQSAFPSLAIQRLQAYINILETWLVKWKIRVNVDKTQAILFTRRKKINGKLSLYEQEIPWAKQVLYLGVILCNTLTWTPHITSIIQKFRVAKITLHPLIARNSVLSIDNKLLIYKTVLRPILCYACPVWAYSCKSSRKRLQRVQNLILRQITNAPWYIRNSKIHEELKVEEICKFYGRLARKFYANLPNIENPDLFSGSSAAFPDCIVYVTCLNLHTP